MCNGRHPIILHGIKVEINKSKTGTNEIAAIPAQHLRANMM